LIAAFGSLPAKGVPVDFVLRDFLKTARCQNEPNFPSLVWDSARESLRSGYAGLGGMQRLDNFEV
jgi:hypothetical protein